MERYISVLKSCHLFRDLPEEVIQNSLLPHCQLKNVSKGSYLIGPQECLNHFGIVLQGSIRTLHIFHDGSYSIMDVLEKSEVFGADLIYTKTRISPYHAMAAEPTSLLFFPCSMLLLPGEIEEQIRQQIQQKLLLLISNCNMQKEYRLAILSQKGLRERVLTYLTMQSNKRHTDSFTIPFSREEMASFLCVNRSALSHELSKMAQEGILSFQKNRFTLHKDIRL